MCLLLDRLNADPEIAFIVPDDPLGPESKKPDQTPRHSPVFHVHRDRDGDLELEMGRSHRQRWKAVRVVDTLKDREHSLWHVPAGPLPLIEVDTGPRPLIGPEGARFAPISDPWAGWIGPPGFGSGCHPWIRLELWTRHRPYTQQERSALHELNAFWLDQNDMLVVSDFQWTGSHFRPAPPQTQRWWNRMKSWVDRSAIKLRADPGFWAFPSALQKLKGGMGYYSRNFDLDGAIRNAEISMICGTRKVSPTIRVTQQQLITAVIAESAIKVDRLRLEVGIGRSDMIAEIPSLYSLTGGRRARSRI